ncbi:hypothetical protein ACIA5G_15660 [Amycolatopsis sp. NPDC051758]|uniref:hypothetical protein n=1 Tax=Amycolatopsis sp. NPDC051758 TaxID=3363935 RepID=UPI00378E4EA5
MVKHNVVRSRPGGRRRLLGVVLAIGLGMVSAVPAAQAETVPASPTLQRNFTSSTSDKPVARITAEMKFDCAGMSAEALTKAVEQKQCPAPGDASTDGTVTGNCGAAWIDIFDDLPGDGVARVVWGMTSYQGPMVYRSLLVSYNFTTIDMGIISGALVDSSVMFSPYYQATTTATSPRPSALALTLSGGVTLLSGSGCVILSPTAFLPIS